MVVKNANGADSLVKNQYVVVNALPVAAFGAADSVGCFPLQVNFTDLSEPGSGAITNWQWDFGDGALSNEQNPVHTYIASGNFIVVLKVTKSNGCSQFISKSSYINVQNVVKAGFSYPSVLSCTSPASVNSLIRLLVQAI